LTLDLQFATVPFVFQEPLPAAPLQDARTLARIARAEERLAMLRALAELGMDMTRELTRRTLEAPVAAAETPAPPPRHDPAESFARLSRAVRLTISLEAKADDELAALIGGGASPPEPDHAWGFATPQAPVSGGVDRSDKPPPVFGPLPRDYPTAKRNQVRDAVFDVIDHEISEIIPAHEIMNDFYERLLEGGPYDEFIDRPLREVVEAICKDLGLHPDWSRWTDDGWPPPPPGPRRIWSYFWAPRRELLYWHHQRKAERALKSGASP
jgi:hypothetical protein